MGRADAKGPDVTRPLLKIYPRESGWVAELWAIEEDDQRTETLLEIWAGHRRMQEAFDHAADVTRRFVEERKVVANG